MELIKVKRIGGDAADSINISAAGELAIRVDELLGGGVTGGKAGPGEGISHKALGNVD